MDTMSIKKLQIKRSQENRLQIKILISKNLQRMIGTIGSEGE